MLMKALNLLQNKHIPDVYRINDRETRLEVLAGLIDTDGYLCFNCYEICTKYEMLKNDILYLARSLGFAAYSSQKMVKDKKYHRIRISGEISLIPTKVKRKIGHERQQTKNVLRVGLELEEAGYGEYYGFELDKDGLYCLGDFTVTHNSTFAQALAEYYADQGRIVKTVEAPRDLILKDNVTQYAISHGDAQEIHDILLLSRPDNTIFDEMRNTEDFRLFADLRLAGIGLAGVVHATNPIDAIQRFVGRIELGVIPQVIDTVIFIKNGAIDKVLSLQMVVKVPSGMTEADLARPVVVVNDFETKRLEYELYSYGEETVVVPVRENAKPASHQLAARAIEQEIKKITSECTVDMVSDQKCIVYVPKEDIAKLIGKQGKTIEQVEKKLGISIDVQELKQESQKSSVPFEAQITKKAVQFFLNSKYQAKDVDIYVGKDYLLSAKIGKAGVIKIDKNNKIGRILVDAVNMGEKIEILL
jgi:predicted PilT family ATPase